jgi:GLPGLI family protein
MKHLFSTIAFTLLFFLHGVAQRVVSDCTITYVISTSTEEGNSNKDATESSKTSTNEAYISTTKTVYIKGNDSRIDLVSPFFTLSQLYNKTTGNAVILREIGNNNKFMTRLDNAKWVAENKKYDGMTISFSGTETKTILGYECKKAVMQTKDGSSFTLYYATAIVPSVREFEYQFKDIPGFVLEFESQETDNNKKIKYTATKINLSPVQASRFDVPTSGYRLLN